ncbi:MAG: ACP S-malonyltransferase [Clostridiaceae bacterium]|nr:ACP S-malonyltransferase [Clostridiaceae bacterium]
MSRIAFVFSGQGSQYIGMAKDICENFKEAADIFKQASESLGYDMEEMVFYGDEETLKITENTQPALVTASIACLQPLLIEGITAEFAAGLSLGEYSAHVYSGTFSFENAVKLVRKRGKFMQEAVPIGVGSMTAILGIDRESVFKACSMAKDQGVVEPANFNCPGQIVISGHIKAVEKASAVALEMGAKRAVPLAVSAPFHCSLLIPAGEKLREEFEKVRINPMRVPVLANITGDVVESEEFVKESLINQVSRCVMWEDCVRTMISKGVDTFVEIGPGKVLSGFIKKIDKNVKVLNVEDMDSLKAAISAIKR